MPTYHAWTREQGSSAPFVSSYLTARTHANAEYAFAHLREIEPGSEATLAKDQTSASGNYVEDSHPALFPVKCQL